MLTEGHIYMDIGQRCPHLQNIAGNYFWAPAAERHDSAPARKRGGHCVNVALKNPRYYRARAADCERTAELTPDPEARELMLHVAARWRGLAEQAGATLLAGAERSPSPPSSQERDHDDPGFKPPC